MLCFDCYKWNENFLLFHFMYCVSCLYTVCIHFMYDIFHYVCDCVCFYICFLFFCKDTGVCIQRWVCLSYESPPAYIAEECRCWLSHSHTSLTFLHQHRRTGCLSLQTHSHHTFSCLLKLWWCSKTDAILCFSYKTKHFRVTHSWPCVF